MREVELKSVVPSPDRTIAAVRAAGAVAVLDGRLSDTRYDTAAGDLLARDHVLRLRVCAEAAATSASLDFKGPTTFVDGYKVREEISTSVGDDLAIRELLERLGYRVIREVERHIVQFALHGATVRFERYPRMDALVEVEGEPDAIERAIAGTGLPREGFTAERLSDFVARYEARTGARAALCARELAGDFRYSPNA